MHLLGRENDEETVNVRNGDSGCWWLVVGVLIEYDCTADILTFSSEVSITKLRAAHGASQACTHTRPDTHLQQAELLVWR